MPNMEKLKAMQAAQRVGGKGAPRRNKKVVHKSAAGDEKKLQNAIKRLPAQPIPDIATVNMFTKSGKVLMFQNPKVMAAVNANTVAVTGTPQEKELSEVLPQVIQEMGPESMGILQQILQKAGVGAEGAKEAAAGGDDDDVPELVENFDETAE
eukprot:Clim_evm12s234 gene=Clim_evmTU12s234